MRPAGSVLLIVVAVVLVVGGGGCALGESGIRRGAAIAQVQGELGPPDVISDRSGDLARYYVPARRPPEEWPSDAPRTLYYLERDLALTFVRGRAVRAEAIPDETREVVLLPLVRRHTEVAK